MRHVQAIELSHELRDTLHHLHLLFLIHSGGEHPFAAPIVKVCKELICCRLHGWHQATDRQIKWCNKELDKANLRVWHIVLLPVVQVLHAQSKFLLSVTLIEVFSHNHVGPDLAQCPRLASGRHITQVKEHITQCLSCFFFIEYFGCLP